MMPSVFDEILNKGWKIVDFSDFKNCQFSDINLTHIQSCSLRARDIVTFSFKCKKYSYMFLANIAEANIGVRLSGDFNDLLNKKTYISGVEQTVSLNCKSATTKLTEEWNIYGRVDISTYPSEPLFHTSSILWKGETSLGQGFGILLLKKTNNKE